MLAPNRKGRSFDPPHYIGLYCSRQRLTAPIICARLLGAESGAFGSLPIVRRSVTMSENFFFLSSRGRIRYRSRTSGGISRPCALHCHSPIELLHEGWSQHAYRALGSSPCVASPYLKIPRSIFFCQVIEASSLGSTCRYVSSHQYDTCISAAESQPRSHSSVLCSGARVFFLPSSQSQLATVLNSQTLLISGLYP